MLCVNRSAEDHSVGPNFIEVCMYIYNHKCMAIIPEDCTSEC